MCSSLSMVEKCLARSDSKAIFAFAKMSSTSPDSGYSRRYNCSATSTPTPSAQYRTASRVVIRTSLQYFLEDKLLIVLLSLHGTTKRRDTNEHADT